MSPRIKSGELVTVEPCNPASIKKNDIVFCRVGLKYYVHLVQSVQQKMDGYRFQIGNLKGHTNGTISEQNIFGKITKIG